MNDLRAGTHTLRENARRIAALVPELRVIYTDIDGTLVGPGGCFFRLADGGLSLRPAEALVRALTAEVDITLVSGRSAEQLREDARLLGLRNYIAEMGGIIVHDLGARNHEPLLEGRPVNGSYHRDMEASGVIEALLRRFHGRLDHHTPWSVGREVTALFRGRLEVAQANRFLADHGFGDYVLVDNGRIGRLASQTLPAELHGYHLIPRGISKEAGVQRDLELRGLKAEQAIAIGDAETDLGLAGVVGAAFLVGNALTESPQLSEQMSGHSNVFVAEGAMGLGWAEVVDFFLGGD